MPIKPLVDWPSLADLENRHFKGPVWNLTEVQAIVRTRGRDAILFATDDAADDLTNSLRWNVEALCGFITTLSFSHYRGSQLCLGSRTGKKAFPCDAYVMGYSQIRRAEWQQQIPRSYFKFSMLTSDQVFVFSIHPEEQ